MVGFVRDALPRRWPAFAYWHPGDVTWMLYADADRVVDDIRLWTDGDATTGFAWFYAPVFVRLDARPGIPRLVDEMLEWAEEKRTREAQGRDKGLSTIALESDPERIAVLESRGYERIERGNVHMRRSLEDPVEETRLPEGMHFRSCVDIDLEERAGAHRDAWSHLEHLGMPDAQSRFSLLAYEQLRREPGYRADLDLVVETRDGAHASCLIAWSDDANRVGLIEPVGTRDAWRRKGLARALNLEALRRLREAGMRSAQISTTSFNDRAEATYLSCGFEIVDRDWFWVKRLGPG
jgi:ribosomal protein S18 acetylase RimI-like enzyme